jgi:ADP-ribosyl-[dinitrogen reductase] hydrolase
MLPKGASRNVDHMTMRTSDSDPIRIAELPVYDAGGLLGVTFCLGKKDPHAGWDRDLDADLDAIQAWGAAAVVTLLEPHEFPLLGVDELAAGLKRRGIAWFHLPITDISVPDERFTQRWQSDGPRIHALLEAGNRVVVHCRGGIGRAGTVSACILVEAGLAPRAAIAEVRRVRPGAIETVAQETFVRTYRPAPRARS